MPPIAGRVQLTAPPGARDLLFGGPDPALLPEWPSVPVSGEGRSYGEPAVSPTLAPLARRRFQRDGIDATHLAVVGGALDGVERVLAAWLRPGDRVAVEDPCYAATLDLLAAMDLDAVPVAMDWRGVRPDMLAAALQRGCRATVVSPRAQNPTGAAWDAERARQLSRVLGARAETLVIEDDHAGEIAGVPARTVAGSTSRWAVVRSVSKSLGPDLRLALMAGDEATVSRVAGRQAVGTGWVSYHLQERVADLWSDPSTRQLLRRARDTYARRRAALRQALDAVGHPCLGHSGLCMWVPTTDEPGLVSALVADGWAVTPGVRFRIAADPGIRIAIATLQPKEAAQLATAVDGAVRRRPVRAD